MPRSEDAVSLDLVPAHLVVPRIRKAAGIAAAVGLAVGVLVWLFAPWWVAALVALVLAVPPVLFAYAAARRHIRLDGTLLSAGGPFRTVQIDTREIVGVEVIVRVAKISQVILRLNDGRHRLLSVPLALYTDGGGRELDILPLRRLADALDAGNVAPAAAASAVLVEQLRAEARGAGLQERPLFRAVELARDSGRTPQTTLTDHEVARLLE